MMSDEERQRTIDDYYYAVQNGIPVTQEMYESFKDASIGIKGYTAASNKALASLGKAAMDTAKAMYQGKQGAEVMADSVETVTDAVGELGIVLAALGGPLGLLAGALGVGIIALGKYNKAASQQADVLFKAYKDLSATGQSAAGGMTEIFENMQKFGYGIEQLGDMTALLKENSKELASFGGTAASGTKAFANAAKEIQRSDIGTSLQMLGKTPDDINKGIALFVKQQQNIGVSSANINKNLADQSGAYIKNLDLLSKLTGESAEQMQSKLEDAQAEDAFNQTQYELKRKADAGDIQASKQYTANNEIAMRLTGTALKEFQQGVGGDVSAMSKTFMTAHGAVELLNKGVYSAEDYIGALAKGAGQARDTFGGLAKYNATSDFLLPMSEISKMQSRYADETAEQQRERAKAEQELQQKGLDPTTKSQIELRLQQMRARDELQSFVNAGVLPATNAMKALAGVTNAAAGVANKVTPGAETPGGGKAIGGGKTESAPGGKAGATVAGGVAGAALGYGAGVLGGAEAGAALGGGIGALFGGVGAVPGALIGGALGGVYGGIAGAGLGGALGAGLGHTFGGSPESQNTRSVPSTGDVSSYLTFGGQSGSRASFDQLDENVRNRVMQAAQQYFQETGRRLTVTSAVRSLEDQQRLYDETVRRGTPGIGPSGMPVARPGTSVHESGRAIDIEEGKTDPRAVAALNQAGLRQTVAGDPVHFMELGGIIKARPGGTSVVAGEAGQDEAFVPLTRGKIPVDIKDSAFVKEFVKGLMGNMGPDQQRSANISKEQADLVRQLMPEFSKAIALGVGDIKITQSSSDKQPIDTQAMAKAIASSLGDLKQQPIDTQAMAKAISSNLGDMKQQQPIDTQAMAKLISNTMSDFKAVQPAGGELTRNPAPDTKIADSMNNIKSLLDSFVNTKIPSPGEMLKSVMPDFSKILPVNDMVNAIAEKINQQTAQKEKVSTTAPPPAADNSQQLALMSQQLNKLDELVRVMNSQLNVSGKILAYQH